MINLLIGPPGGGKSYEAVVFHVLASLEAGRKVITNLPLNIDELAAIVPAARTLIEFRNRVGKPGVPESWAFGDLADYGDSWRHPNGSNVGPLYVIDECHKPLPRRGLMDKGGAPIDEWYAEHRHEGADVLLMTQSYGKVSKAIIDQVQVCYRVKKKTAFGDSSGYIRKVQDGVRGDVISIAERTYEPRFFKLYKSHTRVEAAVIEADAKDVSPAFLKWKLAGRIVFALGSVGFAVSLYNVWRHHTASAHAGSARTKEHAAAGIAAPSGSVSTSSAARHPLPSPLPPSPAGRVIGVYQSVTLAFAVIYTNGEDIRIPLSSCTPLPMYGWSCLFGGGTVTTFTGKAPPHDDVGGSANFFKAAFN